MKANIATLGRTYQIINLQQTRLQRNDHWSLEEESLMPGWGRYRSNCHHNRAAGVLTMLSPRVMATYSIQKVTAIEDHEDLKGRALQLHLIPKDKTSQAPNEARLLNLYLPAEGNKARAEFIQVLLDTLDPSGFQVVAGDFNFVTDKGPEPSSSDLVNKWSKDKNLTQQLRRLWEKLVAKLCLHEGPQTEDTYFHIVAGDPAASTTSKIDRIYTSHTQAELALLERVGHIAHIPFNLVGSYVKDDHGVMRKKGDCSDHAPVGALFIANAVKGKRKTRIQKWTIDHPLFEKHFAAHWHKAADHVSALEELHNFKDQVRASAKQVSNKFPSVVFELV